MSNELAVNNEASAVMTMIERVATDPNMSIEKLEKMLDMQERILDRNAKQSYAAAFARMQAKLPLISMNGEIKHNDRLISKYAKFEDINEAVRPILHEFGFGLSFRVKQLDGKIEIIAILSHEEGHSEETSITLPADTSGAKNAVQSLGSSVSYGKRYTMCALLNISTGGEDNDGVGGTVDTEQAAAIDTLLRDTKADRKAFLTYFKVDDVRKLRSADYDNAVIMLKAKVKKNG